MNDTEPDQSGGAVATDVTPEELALARAVMYRFIGAAFTYPADQDHVDTVRELCDGARHAAETLTPDPGRIVAWIDEIATGLADDSLATTQDECARLFGHAAQGTCPPYEGEYGERDEGLQQPHELADIVAFYRAFGVRLTAKDRVDFVGVEAEFLAFLCGKEAYGLERADDRLIEAACDGQRGFLRDHFGRWVPAFARRTAQYAGSGTYAALARLADAFVEAEGARLDVPLGASHARVRVPLEGPEECLECPFANDAEPQ